MASNPNASIRLLNGQLRPVIDSADAIVLKLGPSAAGPYLTPVRVSTRAGSAAFKCGPLSRSSAFQADYSGVHYVMRCTGTPGSKSAVTKTAALGTSVGSCTVGYTEYTLHTNVTPVAALNITSGWVTPGVPLPMVVTSGAGTVAHTQTVTYINEAGDNAVETLTIAGAGTVSTTGDVARVVSVTSNIDPVGIQGYTSQWAGPADRFDALKMTCITGGVIGVSGGILPKIQLSLDNDRTRSRTLNVPSDGILQLQTYAGGRTPLDTGLTATFTGGSPGSTLYGALRVAGATTPGDIEYTFLTSGATIQHIVPTLNSQALSVAVVAGAVAVTGATNSAGVKAYLSLGGNFDTVFELNVNGTAGNSVTLRTVTGGAAAVSAIGNAVTFTYVDGVTTVAALEALVGAGVAVTAGTVVIKTAGTGANILAAPGDTHSATNLANGTNAGVSSTANDVATFILTSGSAGAIAARAVLYPYPVGAGTGLIATAAATGSPNGGVLYTPKEEGWSVTHASNGAASGSGSVSVDSISKIITVYLATDADSATTTTATGVLALVAASTAATAKVIPTVTGSGAGLAGINGPIALPVSMATGDVYSLTTTPPTVALSDLQAALTAIGANDTILSIFSLCHVVGEGATSNTLATTEAYAIDWANNRKQFKTFLVEAAYMGSTSESTWEAAVKAAYPTTGEWTGISAGETNTVDSLYGTIDRSGVGTAYISRLTICPISELPSHVDCETTQGIQNAMTGVLVRNALATDPPLWQSEDTLADLNNSNFVTLRTWPGRSGVYVRQGLVYTSEGDDYEFITNRRVANVAAATGYDEIIRFVNSNQVTDVTTGELSEQAAQNIEANIGKAIRNRLMGGNRQHITNFAVRVLRNTNFAVTGQVVAQLTIVPLRAIEEIVLEIGYSTTL